MRLTPCSTATSTRRAASGVATLPTFSNMPVPAKFMVPSA